MALQEIHAARDGFPLLVVLDKGPKKSLLPNSKLAIEPTKSSKDFGSLPRLVADFRKAKRQRAVAPEVSITIKGTETLPLYRSWRGQLAERVPRCEVCDHRIEKGSVGHSGPKL